VVATPGALAALNESGIDAFRLLARHQCGDWGEVPPEAGVENDRWCSAACACCPVIRLPGWRIRIITEADRSVTTLLLPEEY
jgi:hypothetical protein